MPLVGIRCSVEAMLTKACRPKPATRPGRREHDEQILLLHQPQQAAQHDEGEHGEDDEADHHAEFLAGHGEDEIGMRVGQHVLDAALARAAAEQAAIAERLQRRGDLIVVAGVPVEEALHPAAAHAGRTHRRRPPAPHERQQPDADEERGSARDVELREEDGGDHAPACRYPAATSAAARSARNTRDRRCSMPGNAARCAAPR